MLFGGVLWLFLVLPCFAGCPIDRKIVIAGLDYDSARFTSEVASLILDLGYDCGTYIANKNSGDQIPDIANGDADIIMEIWVEEPSPKWVTAKNEGKVTELGMNFGATDEGWFVPTYLVEGPNAKAPDLRGATDLRSKKLADLFKGEFVNCPASWNCKGTNEDKLKAYGLSELYKSVVTNDDKDLRRRVEDAYRHHLPVLFYGWHPDILLGKYQYTKLIESKFDKTIWNRNHACEYPTGKVFIGANKAFADRNPEIVEFLRRWRMGNDDIGSALDDAYSRHLTTMKEEARRFLISRPDVWTPWVSADVAAKLHTNLSDGRSGEHREHP